MNHRNHIVSTCLSVQELIEDIGRDAYAAAHTALLDRRGFEQGLYLAKNRVDGTTGHVTAARWEELTGMSLDDATAHLVGLDPDTAARVTIERGAA